MAIHFIHIIRSFISKHAGAMSIFTKIISGEIPSYKIAEDQHFFAFLDIYPLREGHVLVVPKSETDKLFDLPDDYLKELLVFARPIARAIEKTFNCNRCGISVIGLEVPHAHLHLIPINSANDLNFTQSKLKVPEARMKEIQEQLIAAI
jgi:histidine triad (HIT) family protein